MSSLMKRRNERKYATIFSAAMCGFSKLGTRPFYLGWMLLVLLHLGLLLLLANEPWLIWQPLLSGSHHGSARFVCPRFAGQSASAQHR